MNVWMALTESGKILTLSEFFRNWENQILREWINVVMILATATNGNHHPVLFISFPKRVKRLL